MNAKYNKPLTCSFGTEKYFSKNFLKQFASVPPVVQTGSSNFSSRNHDIATSALKMFINSYFINSILLPVKTAKSIFFQRDNELFHNHYTDFHSTSDLYHRWTWFHLRCLNLATTAKETSSPLLV